MVRAFATLALAGGAALVVLTAAPGEPRLHEHQSRERVLYASVYHSETRAPVPDLDARAFIVREDGVQREVLKVSPATAPMPLAIVVDNSQAAGPTIADLRRAVSTFLELTAGLGPMALVTVADRPTIAVDYTTDREALQQGAGRLFAAPGSGATLLEAITEVTRGLARREAERAALVVISTEHVEFSTLDDRHVLDALRASGAALHAIVLRNPAVSLLSPPARYRASVLDRGPRESGGLVFDVLSSMAYEPSLRQLAAILTTQYRVVYARPEALIPPERVTLSMAPPGLDAAATPARGQGTR